jgi:starch-binding outer membrane protein SusE/F
MLFLFIKNKINVMQIRSRGILIIIMLLCLVYSCKKDDTNAVLNAPGSVSGFTATASTLVLSGANDSMTVTDFKWQAPAYGFPAAASYTMIFDIPSDTSGTNAWANAIKMTIPTNSLEQSFLGTDFNKIMNQLGLPFDVASPVVVRLKSDINQSTGAASTVPSIYSDLGMTVTPYQVILIYPKLYVAADFLNPNWTQLNQPGWVLASVKSDGYYEGYVNFPNAGNNFKLCTLLSWNGTNYGWGGTGTTISGSGSAGNCYFGGPGYCKVAADVNALTISYTKTNWGVAGDFNSWSVSANPMTFSTVTNQWTATNVSLTAGSSFKFVGDPGWASSFGLDSKGNLAFGGGNIIAAKTGVFTVTLDLSNGAGNYSYSVK